MGAERVPAARPSARVGASDDVAEREADAVARRVVAGLAAGPGARSLRAAGLEMRPPLRRSVAPRQSPAVGPEGGRIDEPTQRSIQAAGGEGRALPSTVRSAMEASFGRDLSGVRIHSGPASTEASSRLGAEAFTLGADVYFRDGPPDVAHAPGQHLLAHELAHAVQQTSGRIRRKLGLEFETALPASRWIPGEDNAELDPPVAAGLRDQLLADKNTEYLDRQRVRGHETLLDRTAADGWRVTVDNTSRIGPATRANIEIVTSPPIDVGTDSLAARLEVIRVVSDIQAWVHSVLDSHPEDNRVRIAGMPYVIGFPSDTQIGQIGLPSSFGNFGRALVKPDAYVQVNLGVSMDRASELVEDAVTNANAKTNPEAQLTSATGNVAAFSESEGVASGKTIAMAIVRVLKKGGYTPNERQAASLLGLATLISVAVYGAKVSEEGQLVKKFTMVLPKSGLDKWWKLHLEALEPPTPPIVPVNLPAAVTKQDEDDDEGAEGSGEEETKARTSTPRRPKPNKREARQQRKAGKKAADPGVDAATPFRNALTANMSAVLKCFADEYKANNCGSGLKLFPLRQKEFAEIAELQELAGLKVGTYFESIVKTVDDPLTRAALKHKAATGAGTSAIDAADISADAGRNQPSIAGVVELRNIEPYWALDEWDVNATRYVDIASRLAFG